MGFPIGHFWPNLKKIAETKKIGKFWEKLEKDTFNVFPSKSEHFGEVSWRKLSFDEIRGDYTNFAFFHKAKIRAFEILLRKKDIKVEMEALCVPNLRRNMYNTMIVSLACPRYSNFLFFYFVYFYFIYLLWVGEHPPYPQ